MALLVGESDSCMKNSRSSEENFDLVRPGHIRTAVTVLVVVCYPF